MIKKIIKNFLNGLIILLTSILVVLLVARKIFPPEKLKMLAISKIETAINRQISIGDIWLNPFKGISAKDIVVYEQSTNNNRINDPPWFFKVDKVLLKYHFFSLLKKEIRVSKVIVENPAVNLLQDEFQHWNFDDLITLAQVDTTKSDTAATEFILPLTLDLKELIVKNLTANLKMNQQDIAVSLKSAGITVTVNELKLPRNSYEKIKTESKAHLKILSLDEPWSFSLQFDSLPGKIEMNARVQTNVDFQFAGFSNLAGNGVLALADVNLVHYMNRTDDPIDKKFPLHQLCSFSFDFFGNINEELIKLKHFVATIGNEKIFDISGEMNQVLSDPSVDLQIVDSKIGLNSLLNSFVPLLPDRLQSQFEKLTVDGIASLTGTKISGWPLSDSLKKSLLFELNFNIQNMSAFYTEPASKLSNVNLEIKSSAIFNLKGVQKVDLGMKMLIQSLAATLDTTNFVFEDLSAELSTTINDKFIPDSLSTSIKIKNFFHVPLNFSFDFKPEQGLKKYDARANLSFFELSLAEVTNSAAEGDIDFSLDVHSRKLSRIDAQVNISTDIIEVAAEDDPIIIYPMDILSIAVLSADSSLKSIKLDSLRMKFDNFASLFVHGDFLIDPVQKLTASVDSFTIDHKKVLEIIPEQFLEGFENLTVSGSSNLTSDIKIALKDTGNPLIDIKGSVEINAKGELPELFVSWGGFNGNINFNTDGKIASANMNAILDSLAMEEFQDEPLRNIIADIKIKTPNFETVLVESSTVKIPDLQTTILFSAKIDSLFGQMRTKATSKLIMDTQHDTVMLLNVINLSGRVEQNTNFGLDGNIASVDGEINFQGLNIDYDNMVLVDSISGIIHFAQKFDIEKATIVESNREQTVLADASTFYYDLLRPYYKLSGQKFSHFQINKIKSLDYHVEDVNVDLVISNERIEIPRFSMNLYDGNMSGLINVNVHDGDLEKIEWKVKANLSRMNSAKLIPTNKKEGKDADLNMNLELVGRGIDPAGYVDVGGYLYVTKIGPRFTDNVLKSLDPKRTDKSIQDTRKLLNWGYKPKLISFEIKHDNLYPSIHLIKGNFFTKLIPLNLSGGKIELARIPVKFFLSNFEMEAK